MTKMTIILIALLFAVFANATEGTKVSRKVAQAAVQCASTIDEVVAQVKNSSSCYDAMNIAKQCAWGSSADVQLVVSAQTICEKDFKKITKDDALLKAKMARRCERLCNSQTDGTMCLSEIAFCKLSVTEFFSNFYSPRG